MLKIYNNGAFLINGESILKDESTALNQIYSLTGISTNKAEARKNTISYSVLKSHNTSDNMKNLQLRFDSMASHDITYVGIIQTALASGLTEFPIPYVLTNCHNSLCAVGGTINEDDHLFGLSAAKKFGGIYVPAHQAVIHQYMREKMSGCGKMILGSDSHTRYGALGTMAIGEGGPELVKQLLGNTYDTDYPEIVAVFLTGQLSYGVGPQDVALSIIGSVFKDGTVKNKILEFVGDGISNLNMDVRCGIDVMTTETTCLSSIWATDSATEEYFINHARPEDYKPLTPGNIAYYDAIIKINLSEIIPMIALPFHPSNIFSIKELNSNAGDILRQAEITGQKQLDNPNFHLTQHLDHGKLKIGQGVIGGCAGGSYDNLCDTADILRGNSIGNDDFSLSLYPASQPILSALVQNGTMSDFINAGATVRTAFCGPCFGAGDVPANDVLSARHSTRNFPNREGSKPSDGQIASVALMDARSIAATAINNGLLTSAADLDIKYTKPSYKFNSSIYDKRVYQGFKNAQPDFPLKMGPNITPWPQMHSLTENLILQVACVIKDPVTTTDELIPSGETSSYRSNPLKLAEFTLSRKDPLYVSRAKEIQKAENLRLNGENPIKSNANLEHVFKLILEAGYELNPLENSIGSLIYAVKPGDGSAREQAASCQRVLGGFANISHEYATKRYRSNLINWGMLPFILPDTGEELPFDLGDFVFIPNIRNAIKIKSENISAYAIKPNKITAFTLHLASLTEDERKIILSGCLINSSNLSKAN